MKTALIGYTGFVGSNLANQFNFDYKYNSLNISEIKNKKFDLLICAGVRAEKWLANQKPEDDLNNINNLIEHLKTIEVENFVLISTIDVYPNPVKVNERTIINPKKNDDYGRNRYYVEKFVNRHFTNCTIIRLPALFGKGLKKNFIYDLLHRVPQYIMGNKFSELLNRLDDNEEKKFLINNYSMDNNKNFILKDRVVDETLLDLQNILERKDFSSLIFNHKDSIFQFYYLENLWEDIKVALNNSLSLVNFATEPIFAKNIAKELFNLDFENITSIPPLNYDMQTIYDQLFNGNYGYIYNKEQVYQHLIDYLKNFRE